MSYLNFYEYPLVLDVVTNSATSVAVRNAQWMINPTFDLPYGEKEGIVRLIEKLTLTIKHNISSYAPRFNTGGYELVNPIVEEHVKALDNLLAGVVNLESNGLKSTSLYRTIMEHAKSIDNIEKKVLSDVSVVFNIVGEISHVEIGGHPFDNNSEPRPDSELQFLVNLFEYFEVRSFKCTFPGVTYWMRRIVTDGLLPAELLLTYYDDAKFFYWDFTSRKWRTKEEGVGGLDVLLNTQKVPLENMKLCRIGNIVEDYVTSILLLPVYGPNDVPFKNVAALTSFCSTSIPNNAIREIMAFSNKNSAISTGLCPDAVDTLPEGHSIAWAIRVANAPKTDIKPEKYYIPAEMWS